MASLRALFDAAADSDVTDVPSLLVNSRQWHFFCANVRSHGLSSPLFERVLSTAALQGGRLRFEDLALTAAALIPEAAVDKTLNDLQADSSALRRFVAHVRAHAAPGSSERRHVEAGVEDVAGAYRATLLRLLRLAVKEAEAMDGMESHATLFAPLEAALRAEMPEATACAPMGSLLASPALAPSPFDFQRVHARAVAVRLAATHVAAHSLRLAQRLYHKPGAEGGAKGGSADAARLRAAAVEVLYATRGGATFEAAAATGVPFELEVVRVPSLCAQDAIAAASLSLHAHEALSALAEGVEVGEDGARAAADALAAGGVAVPAPSALHSAPQARLSSLRALYADYTAAGELILSPYFADPCAVHEAEAEGGAAAASAAILGNPTLFCYEYIPGLVPVSQLLQRCGPLREGQPLFRYVASELLRALCDVECQCTLSLPASHRAVTLRHVYLSDSGSRLTLRGLPWGAPIAESALTAPGALRARSRTLLRCYGAMLRALLGLGGGGGGGGGETSTPRAAASAAAAAAAARALPRAVRAAAAAAGTTTLAVGEVTTLLLEPPPPGCVWLPPLLHGRGGAPPPALTACACAGEEVDGAAPLFTVTAGAEGEGTLLLFALREGAEAPLRGSDGLLSHAPHGEALGRAPLALPLRACSAAPSPTLSTVLRCVGAAADTASSAVATVRLLAALLARGGGGGGDGGGGFAELARFLCGVFALGEEGGGGEGVSAAGGVHEADALAALVRAVQEPAGAPLPPSFFGGGGARRGGVTAGDADAAEAGGAEGGAAAAFFAPTRAEALLWAAHLARLEYFSSRGFVGGGEGGADVELMDDWAGYTAPLRHEQGLV